ncbi:MAG: hypothetical protein JXL80_17275 [Planctomycetes bacterium]|nr:hypothetical protein [Planctomycetota bacterium]
MPGKTCCIIAAVFALLLIAPGPVADAQRRGGGNEARTFTVLDLTSPWRLHESLKPPLVRQGSSTKPLEMPQRWMNWESPEPPADWTRPEFDDRAWFYGPASRAGTTPRLARLCLRGRFTVTDPAKVRSLKLSLAYHGGAIVYVNGKELKRGDVAVGVAKAVKDYPESAFITRQNDYLAPDGAYLNGKPSGKADADAEQRRKAWQRELSDVAVPSSLLRRGENVVAVEILRTPYDFRKVKSPGADFPYEFTWYTCQLLDVQLAAASDNGLVSSAVRPEGLQVFNSNPLAGDFDVDFGNPAEPLRPIVLTGAANGSFSGKVVVGSTKPLGRLAAKAGALAGPGGSIPATAVRVRYAAAWGEEHLTDQVYHGLPRPYPGRTALMDMLLEEPPAGGSGEGRGGPANVVGVWVTVDVPKATKAGLYKGTVTITVAGEKPVAVPVELTVADWTLPDAQDWRTWVELMQSPDTLALEYGVPLWSERHWQLIARSFDHLRQVGSRVLYVPLLAHANLGNDESMVRWVEKGNNRFEHDFAIMDKYLDLAEKHMGKPKIVIFNVWDVYMIPKKNPTAGQGGGHRRMVGSFDPEQAAKMGTGPLVTVLDPKSGKTDSAYLPTFFEPAAKALWKPLFGALRQRMKRRGLEDAMMLGMVTDAYPSKEEVALLKDLSGGLPWVSHGHGGFEPNQLLHGLSPIGYQACVWFTQFADQVVTHGKAWGDEPMYGWQRDPLRVAYERNTDLDSYPLTRWRQMGESNITGGQRGMGRIGADYWPVVKDNRGRRRGRVWDRFPESRWMNLNICNSLLAPGPNGPVATSRFEAFREGVQECEARIVIERALTDGKMAARLGAPLAKRCRELLDERMLVLWNSLSNQQLTGPGWQNGIGWRWSAGVSGHVWYVGSADWQKRSLDLYALAGEVTRKVGR